MIFHQAGPEEPGMHIFQLLGDSPWPLQNGPDLLSQGPPSILRIGIAVDAKVLRNREGSYQLH